MPKLTLTSDKFPAINFPVPQVPGETYAGSFQFHMNYPYDVTQETADAIAAHHAKLTPRVRDQIKISIKGDAPKGADAIAKPAPPPAGFKPTAPVEPETVIEAEVVDDDDWLAAEIERISKIRSNDKATTELMNVATNDEQFSLADRVAVLEGVIASDRTRDAVKEQAQELLTELNDGSPAAE